MVIMSLNGYGLRWLWSKKYEFYIVMIFFGMLKDTGSFSYKKKENLDSVQYLYTHSAFPLDFKVSTFQAVFWT